MNRMFKLNYPCQLTYKTYERKHKPLYMCVCVCVCVCVSDGVALDGDDPKHIQWVYQKSLERAAEFNITGVTYRLTQGEYPKPI